MFRVSRNREISGTSEVELVRSAAEAIRQALPGTWTLDVDPHPARIGPRSVRDPDAVFTIVAPDGTSAIVLVECKGVVAPRDVANVAREVDAYANAAPPGKQAGFAMLVSPFVSPTTRRRLEERGLGWFDSTGNLRLRLDRPAVFIDRAGADRSGLRDPADRQLKSLRGPAAAKVVLELCEISLPIGVRDLAERAGVGNGTSARVLELLDREAAVGRDDDGAVVSVRKRRMVERWALDYKVMTFNDVLTTLDARGLAHALDMLSELDGAVAATGSAAARAYLPEDMTPVSPLVSLSLYAADPISLMARLGLRRVERGANVLVMRPYDEVVLSRTRVVGSLRCAAPAQVVADLLTGPGRASEEAEQLMAVLASVEEGWES